MGEEKEIISESKIKAGGGKKKWEEGIKVVVWEKKGKNERARNTDKRKELNNNKKGVKTKKNVKEWSSKIKK